MPLARPEILAPAGDRAALEAAVRAGADAVYFGLAAHNARARARNFDDHELAETLRYLHAHGVKGYITLNTLVFDHEIPELERAILACARASADAIIVQDLGLARLARDIAPHLPIHASTQMTCTDAKGVELARELGASRVILARELSLHDIAQIREKTDAELEVFVHGALCIAYSGQCLTSEAIGGRSANRGACAQACRLPYQLVVDGVLHELGDAAYLLSPEDLEASELVPELCALGISSLKIEGRLKGPEYVAATVRLYRKAIDAALGEGPKPTDTERRAALQMFSRGSGPGFLRGVDHQRLVDGTTCDHRGIELGKAISHVRRHGRDLIRVRAFAPMARGEGILVQGGFAGEGEVGGRIWALYVNGREVEESPANRDLEIWLGPDKHLPAIHEGRAVYRTSAPALEREITHELQQNPYRVALDLRFEGKIGQAPTLSATSVRGHKASVVLDALLEPAQKNPLDPNTLRDKLDRLGDTPFVLRHLELEIDGAAFISPSALNRGRRALTEALTSSTTPAPAPASASAPAPASASASAPAPASASGPGPAIHGLFVLCRNIVQARAALEAGASGVYLDFLEMVGLGNALRELRNEGAFVGVAPPRIRKPGEEKIDRYLRSLEPSLLLVRSLGALAENDTDIPRIGDFSLNITNRLSASYVLSRNLIAFTPSFDLDAAQLCALLDSPLAPCAEVVLHHPMPLFHMEHCVIARALSKGRDHKTCGRPCEEHALSLRDRAGMDHPLEADVGCRNTVFHASPQSAADLVPRLQKSGVLRFRIELVREDAENARRVVTAYRRLLEGRIDPAELRRSLRTEGGYGVVRGSLRVLPT